MSDTNVGSGMAPCRKGCRCSDCQIDALRAQLSAARAERDAAVRDAERYRWIRSQGGSWETEAFLSGLTPEQYDAAIDKALKP